MELKVYLQIIKQQKKVIVITAILVAFFSFIFSFFVPVYSETSVSVEIERKAVQETTDYRYDDYYALKASEIYVDSIAKWFSSPEFVNQICQKADIKTEDLSLRKIKKMFKADKMSAQYLEIKFKAENSQEAKKISSAIASVLESKSKDLGWTDEEKNIFSIKTSEPVIIEKKSPIFLNTFIGFLSGLFIGILIGFFRKYLE
jgi:capsular polysaccharide biosynthesis protein